MQIATLTLPELRNLYDTALVRDFPPAERKPFSAMEALLRRGLYEPLVFTDPAGERVAYALQVAAPDVPCGLIDYFAVRPDLRGSGVGTGALHALRRHYAGRLQARPRNSKAAHRVLSARRGAERRDGKPRCGGALYGAGTALPRDPVGGGRRRCPAPPVHRDEPAKLWARQRNILRELRAYYPQKGGMMRETEPKTIRRNG